MRFPQPGHLTYLISLYCHAFQNPAQYCSVSTRTSFASNSKPHPQEEQVFKFGLMIIFDICHKLQFYYHKWGKLLYLLCRFHHSRFRHHNLFQHFLCHHPHIQGRFYNESTDRYFLLVFSFQIVPILFVFLASLSGVTDTSPTVKYNH